MSTSKKTETYTTIPNEWPLRFEKHSFSAHCYDTAGCSVLYNENYLIKDDADKTRPSSSSIGANYQKGWGSAAQIGIKNFPSAANVNWRSKDGVSHEAKINIAEIFKDQQIRHNVPREDIPTDTVAATDSPNICLEINDRTVKVYMKAMVYLKDTATRRSDFRNDLILVYSHTY